ncbi:M24 family metallopeptidase [Litorivicinus lipolyticus]|uniref:M24 family metallopeptidase n=1 Tax=Litorivicinus lipolyticus TaxID=418701 RepID=A0A5Q2QAZ3_9GAMM|nr:dimethylsulfonioproprionate lyase DddP [Litorivicinus lipolyticus]QGG80433.1 M24 family metallopeptidase [Litorivicinus lipolyticus]
MNRPARKINPGDGNSVEIGPTPLALDEWAQASLQLPDLTVMRRYRLDRLVAQLHRHDCAGLLMFDPLNIRYATDSTNMQLWNTHNPFRAVLVCADGYMVIWDYKGCGFLSDHNPLVREKRHGADLFYFDRGDGADAAAARFAAEVDALLAEHGRGRLAVDKIMIRGLRALEAAGLTVIEGEPLTERARAIKCDDEIRAMRCAIHATETSVARMHAAATPGMTENDLWSVLHAENIRRGGEWIETRLLTSGPRTNPWFQECGPRIIQNNEIVAFDTDLVGPYGMCCDISRTWWIGDGEPSPKHRAAMRLAIEHIEHNFSLLKPGVNFDALSANAHRLPAPMQAQKYGCVYHGVGLCDEWPMIAYPDGHVPGAFDGVLEPGMVLCVEALVSEAGEDFSIKLEEQALITADGAIMLSSYPWDPRLV